ncbi:hypothetical protein LZG04_38935 [Saccharothrix sp. S26]|uniref:hypothetical protein n=1 Tax=Saccharothrix sp. S26 TaxID=2907215 RepID=UPI001F3C4FC8|nr:hypothetical protein [Saccharothrix sp. S26]MCE7000750.1 hypothetical protein [Saccharothrix sp. S26]
MADTLKPRTPADGPSRNWDAVGPGVGIQTTHRNPVRRVIPAHDRRRGDGADRRVHRAGAGELYRNNRPTSATAAIQQRRWVTRGAIGSGFRPFAGASCLLDHALQRRRARPAGVRELRRHRDPDQEAHPDERGRGPHLGLQPPVRRRAAAGEGGSYREGGYSSIVETADHTARSRSAR